MPILLRICFVLFFLCAAPAIVDARGFDCPSNGSLFTNATRDTWTFLLTVETNVPVSVAWNSPQGARSVTVQVNGVINIAVTAGTAVTYACGDAGYADAQETSHNLYLGVDCFNTLGGALFQELSGSSTPVFASVTNVYTAITLTYTDSSNQSASITINPGSTRDLAAMLGPGSSVTYQCAGISLPPAVFALEIK